MDCTLDSSPHAHPRSHNISNRSASADRREVLSQPSRYAFLNHSALTVNQNLPPTVDDKPLARQRRRRTSPEDQTILEAAYNRNPKPDKAARLEIVERVSLGEKEVQIWFQNRRQTSRRKSRPLLPHEIAQYQLSRNGVGPYLASDPTTISSQEDDAQTSEEALSELERQCETQEILSKGLDASADPQTLSSSDPLTHQASEEQNVSCPQTLHRSEVSMVPSLRQWNMPESHSGHSAIQGSIHSLRRSQSFSNRSLPPMHINGLNSKARLKKSSSCVRLSLSSEGNAEVVTKDSSSPSPPKAMQGPPPSLQRNESNGPGNSSYNTATLPPMRSLQRTSNGRSRDSRVWEFWCDRDARSELGEKAEQDASGSAAGAIGLLRSASGRSILGAIPSKRNSTLSRQSISVKRSRVETSIPKLNKSSTALGRLEGMVTSDTRVYTRPTSMHKPAGSSISVYIPGNESDKENWSPANETLLGDAREKYSTKVQTAFSPNTAGSSPLEDPEVSAFMRGTERVRGVSGDEELDCVQGLLSLSQGNWGR